MPDSQELQELRDWLLRGIRIVEPRAIKCIEGTRTSLLEDVAAKTGNRDGPNAIWIRGAPGSGKSSISLSAKSQLHEEGRLIAYFRFDRNDTAATTSTALWRHTAYHLARRLPSVQPKFLQLLQQDKVDLDSPTAVFTHLIEDPLSNLALPVDHPLVIVIDAVDECGGLEGRSSPDRKALLQTLARWPRLPKHFKLLVTSREEGDIVRVLSSISTYINIPSGHHLVENPQDNASIDASKDIRLFLECCFRDVRQRIPSLPADWPGAKTIDEMVQRAEGNFMWATTAGNFIDCGGIYPQKQVDKIMGHVPGSGGMKSLYSLYAAILEAAFGRIPDGTDIENLRSILGTMVLARRPLQDIEYTNLPTSEPVDATALDSIRDGLRSVVAPGANLRFTHKSFDDFLLSEDCPEKYRIRIDDSQYLLTRLCLTKMTEELHFNKCNLETSSLKNIDVPDIEVKVTNGISSLLSYSCCFWAEHLSLTSFDEGLMRAVKEIVFDKLLYWFEVMSLLKEMNRVSNSLLLILNWSHSSPDDELKDFVHDAHRFIGTFGHPIAQSAPHIYISAVPFAPEHSSIASHFLSLFPQTLALSTGKPTNWPSCIFTSAHHNAEVHSVAFSPNNKYFVSGSDDKTICVCYSETGNLVFGPCEGTGRATDAFFSSDGKRVWARFTNDETSSRDGEVGDEVICWDVETGEQLRKFRIGRAIGCHHFNGDQNIISVSSNAIMSWCAYTGKRLLDLPINDSVYTVSFSPDGRHMAGASYNDTTIKTWTLEVGGEIQGPSQSRCNYKHTKPVSALSFSIDGSFVVSGSHDGTILVWDAGTGDATDEPLATGRGWLDAVAYSPQAKVVVVASGRSGTVTVWNTSTRQLVLGPLDGHISWITGVALSSDGRKVLSASWDGTVRMWDLGSRTGIMPVNRRNRGHIGTVLFVAFSSCGKKLASIGSDRTIRLWDVNTGTPLLGPISSDSHYSRIVFSPDNSLIAAYDSDETSIIRLWDVETGLLAFYQDLHDENQEHTRVEHLAFRTQSTNLQLISCSSNGVVRIWRMEGDALTEDLNPSSPTAVDASVPVKIHALSFNGLSAVVRDDSRNPSHYIWSTTTRQLVPLSFIDAEYHSTHSPDIIYSLDGQFFVSVHTPHSEGASTATLRVWDTQNGELAAGPSTFGDKIDCLAFSPGCRYIAFSYSSSTSDRTAIWIWDVHTGHVAPNPWRGHTDDITALAFSLAGEKLVSGTKDGQMRIWSTTDLKDPHESYEASNRLTQMEDGWAMDADGKLLFWVPTDHRTKLFWPGNVAVIGRSGITTELDLTKFRFGENWVECIRESN